MTDRSAGRADFRGGPLASGLGMAIVLAVAMLWARPYAWPTADLAQDLPPILARLDGSLYSRDFAVQSFLGPTPRAAFQLLVAAGMRTGASDAATFFGLHLLALIIAAGALASIAEFIGNGRSAATTALLVASVLWVSTFNAAGWSLPILAVGLPSPSAWAMALSLWGWAFALRARWGEAAAFFGLAALMQFLVGVLPVAVLLPVFCCDARGGRIHWRSALIGAFLASVCIAIVVVPLSVDNARAGVPSAEIVRIFGFVRAPHHWLPSAADSAYWLNATLLAVASLLLARHARSSSTDLRVSRVAVAVILATTAAVVVNWIFVEIVPTALIGKLQLQRTLPFAKLGIVGLLAVHLKHLLAARRWWLVVAILAAPGSGMNGLALLSVAVAIAIGVRAPRWTRLSDVSSLALVGLMATARGRWGWDGDPRVFIAIAAGALAIWALATMDHSRITTVSRFASASLVAITGLALLTPNRVSAHRSLRANVPALRQPDQVPASLRRVSAMVASHTRRNDLILAAPIPSLDFLELESRRSVVFSWKNVPYTDAGIREWGSRLDSLTGVRHFTRASEATLTREWANRTSRDLEGLARSYEADFILTRDEWQDNLSAKRVGQSDGWSLWQIRH